MWNKAKNVSFSSCEFQRNKSSTARLISQHQDIRDRDLFSLLSLEFSSAEHVVVSIIVWQYTHMWLQSCCFSYSNLKTSHSSHVKTKEVWSLLTILSLNATNDCNCLLTHNWQRYKFMSGQQVVGNKDMWVYNGHVTIKNNIIMYTPDKSSFYFKPITLTFLLFNFCWLQQVLLSFLKVINTTECELRAMSSDVTRLLSKGSWWMNPKD